ncbi:MAG: RDD family protein [Rhodanobacter denitrificans]|uniref:RDD family protein n=1 Tax=Rhodanobacter denitrificans TaxID=666685 RepID=A0A2W5KRI1_9GAMM|nr:MAG: RDD family protein [Rhodanobacter denitrificans]
MTAPPVPPPSATAAPLWRRLAALGYDLMPLLALWMLTAGLVLLAFRGEVDVAHQPPLYHLSLQAALLAVTAGYFVLSWTRGGQTIGMRAWRIRLVGADGRSPDLRRALLRFAIALPALALVGVGFLWCLIDRDRRAWHDLAAGTRIVGVPKT